jgi:hypothetical protein
VERIEDAYEGQRPANDQKHNHDQDDLDDGAGSLPHRWERR